MAIVSLFPRLNANEEPWESVRMKETISLCVQTEAHISNLFRLHSAKSTQFLSQGRAPGLPLLPSVMNGRD